MNFYGWIQKTNKNSTKSIEEVDVMKKLIYLLSVVVFLFSSTNFLFAQCGVSLFVDSAPNVYGSPNYPIWEAAAFAAAASGLFVNMANGINPANIGTTNFEIEDEVVYSFGDLGKRLTWIYWIPNATVADLDANNRFEISLINIWDGSVLDFYDYYYGSTWLEPTKWKDYMGGVIGTAGMAWWGAYNTNTQAELDADIALWSLSEETWIFKTKLDGIECSITSYRAPIPEPGTFLLLGSGFLGLGLVGYFRRKRA